MFKLQQTSARFDLAQSHIKRGGSTMRFFIGILVSFLIVGCSNQGDDRLKEKAGIEGREQAEQQRKIEEERSKQMERDLAKRQNFFRALEGMYEGVISETNVKVRLVFTPNRPIYFPDGRVRTNEEVADDLLNLNFEVYVSLQFLDIPEAPPSDCLIADVKPDLVRGFIKVSSSESECPNRFHTYVGEQFLSNWDDAKVEGKLTAQSMISGSIQQIPTLRARNYSANSPEIFEFTLERVENE